jgi:hypothetical protein
MKVIVFLRDDNSVAISHISSVILDALTGSGEFIQESRIEQEIAKHLIGSDSDSEKAYAVNWENFLTSKKGSDREIKARRFVEGLARGGLSESEAIVIMADFTIPDDCTSYQIAEDTEIPTDRYFRNSWEWS